MTWIDYDSVLVEEIAARLDLREPNKLAIQASAKEIAEGDGREVVCSLATGVGKTYILAGLIEYLSAQGVRNILVVTPGRTIHEKTLANFTPGHPKFVGGGDVEPLVITSESFERGQVGDALHDDGVTKVFVFNVQQLIRPSDKTSRRVRETNEFIGTGLYQHLQDVKDLVVIADEHHVYSSSAKAFNNAIADLGARAVVGLTATPAPGSNVIYTYSLAEAIADEHVKIPVIVYREDGRKDEETVLADAGQLLRVKEAAWVAWAEVSGVTPVRPVLFVVCKDIADADRVADRLTRDDMFAGDGEVLVITSQSTDTALAELAAVEDSDSRVRVVVSVDKLKEGWDVKNIGVIVGLRALASETLTEQVLGRGLRLPYGKRVGVPMVDTVDLVAHESYRQLLASKDALMARVVPRGQADVDLTLRKADGVSVPLGSAPAPETPSGQGTLELTARARVVTGEEVESTVFLQFGSMESVLAQGDRDVATTSKLLTKMPGAPTIRFPRRETKVLPVRFSFSYITDQAARSAGAAYASEIKVPLVRKEANVQRNIDGDVRVGWTSAESVDASQKKISGKKLQDDLFTKIWNVDYIDETQPENNAAERVVREFLRGAGVTEQDVDCEWSEQRAGLAVEAIGQLIKAAYDGRKLQPKFEFRVVNIPTVPPPPMPSRVVDRWADFRTNLWFEGWSRSIECVASFDAKTTEFALAGIFDDSPGVEWWLRLYTRRDLASSGVWIELLHEKRYYPDFIVIETDGTHWLIEGKADDRAKDETVQEKKLAGEEWARFVRDHGNLGVWRYLFATESMIKKAAGSWGTLKALAKPE